MKKQNQSRARSIHPWLACALTCLLPLSAAENPAANGSGDSAAASTAPASTQDSEIEQLKKMLVDQQRQIDALRQSLSIAEEIGRYACAGSRQHAAGDSTGNPASESRSSGQRRSDDSSEARAGICAAKGKYG